MTEAPSLYAAAASYEQMIVALARRAGEREVSYSDLDKIANVAAGFVGKAFGPSRTRRLGPLSLFAVVWGLGLRVALVEDPEAAAATADAGLPRRRAQARPGNYARQPSKRIKARVARVNGCKGAKAYAAKTSPELRSAVARHAAMKRHYPNRVLEWNKIKKAVAGATPLSTPRLV
jgi:hypothetical protein